MAFNIILDALTLAMQRLESLSDLSVRLQRLEHLDSALKKPVADGIDDRRLGFFTDEARGFSVFFRGICLYRCLPCDIWGSDERSQG